MPPILLDQIGRVSTPRFAHSVSRVFVVDAHEDKPGFVAVYVSRNGQAVLYESAVLKSFTRTRIPRAAPHIALTEDDESWELRRDGCGCGNPIKRLSVSQALKDNAAGVVGVSAEELVAS